MAEWFSWIDGNVTGSVRLTDIAAIRMHPAPAASFLHVRGGAELLIGHADVVRLRAELGVEAEPTVKP